LRSVGFDAVLIKEGCFAVGSGRRSWCWCWGGSFWKRRGSPGFDGFRRTRGCLRGSLRCRLFCRSLGRRGVLFVEWLFVGRLLGGFLVGVPYLRVLSSVRF